MRDLKSLRPTEICIRATEENADEILIAFKEFDINGFDKDEILSLCNYYFFLEDGKLFATDMKPNPYTEITIEQLMELAEVKEPQTDELWRVETKRHPLGETGDYENVVTLFYGKEKIHFPEDTEVDIVEEIAEGLNELTKLKSENESLKKERDELKGCLKSICSNLWYNGNIVTQFNETQDMHEIFTKSKTLLK